MAQWCLPASSGRDRLTGEFHEIYKGPDGQAILCAAISISGEFFKWAPRWVPRDLNGDMTDNYAVSLPRVILDWQAVDELIFQLGEWLETNDVGINKPKPIQIDLAPKNQSDQAFSIELAETHKLVTSGEKPVCTISYSGIIFDQGVWSFVVDQSCIRNFRDELRAAFSDITAKSSV